LEFPLNVGFECGAAAIARRLDDADEMAAARQRLADCQLLPLNAVERFELSDAYADDGLYGKAAALLENLYPLDRPTEILRRRLFYLLHAEERETARNLYESLGGQVLRIPYIRRLGAAIYERSGMLAMALSELEEAIRLDKEDLRSRLDWVRIALRNGNEDLVRKWVRKACVSRVQSPGDCMELAQIFDRYNRRKDALGIGYDTLLCNWGREERLHLAYLSLFLMHQKRDRFLDVKTAAVDTVIFLENQFGEKERYRIESDVPPAADVLDPSHAFAQALIGKSVGDEIAHRGIGQPTTWKIVGLKHKYLDLFHVALNAHSKLFPDSRAIGRFRVDISDKNSFEPLFENARERSRHIETAVEIYGQQIIPIDVLAKIIGLEPLDASQGIRFETDAWFDTTTGAPSELQAAVEHFKRQEALLLDPITLGIWQEIGFLHIAARLPVRIQVVQSTIDALTVRADHARQLGQGTGSISARGTSISIVPSSREQREATATNRQELLDWVRQHAILVPTPSLPLSANLPIREYLSDASLDTIAVAIQMGTTMVLEDRRLRAVASEMGAVASGWTQPMLIRLLGEKAITRGEYVSLLAALQRQRVGFLSIESHDLVIASSLEGESDDFAAIVDATGSDRAETSSASEVLADFIAVLWSSETDTERREKLSTRTLDRILKSTKAVELLRAIVADCHRALSRNSRGLTREWALYVTGYLRGHFIHHLVFAT